MALDRQDVRRIAALAGLDLTPEEEAIFAAQLGTIVEFFDRLGEFVPAGDPALAAVTDGLREADDVAAPCLPRDDFLANAPRCHDGFLVVPRLPGAARRRVDRRAK